MGETRRKYTGEFKRDAVEIVRTTGKPIAQVAREMGIHDGTLGNWVNKDRVERGERLGLTVEDRARMRELEAENARLRMERDVLIGRVSRVQAVGLFVGNGEGRPRCLAT